MTADKNTRGIQLKQIEMLKIFDKICHDNNLKYLVGFGTLLGAVRHKGFIPWDDDIDLIMLRDDYEKMLKVAPKYLPENLFLQTNKSDPEFPRTYAKLRMNNTTLKTEAFSNLDIHHGICLDIFPVDYTARNKKIQTFHMTLIKYTQILIDYRNINSVKKPYLPIKYTLKFISKLVPKKIIDLVIKYFSILFIKRKNNPVTIFSTRQNFAIDLNILFPVKKLTFEGINVPVPNQWDEYLKCLYGDYMILPPAEERKSHHSVIEVNL